jgi:pentatricopeptide repeat protein
MVSSSVGFETWFISSLVNAGHCPEHSVKLAQAPSFLTARRPNLWRQQKYNASIRRHQHGKAASIQPVTRSAVESKVAEAEEDDDEEGLLPQENRTREELLDLVDQYSGESYTDQLPLLELPNIYQPSDGPFISVSDKEEDEWPPPHCAWSADAETQAKLDQLERAVTANDAAEKDPEEMYQIYRTLPAPRAPYLESNIRHKMLYYLSVVERKDEQSMLRYLSVVDDMKGAAIPLNVCEWTSAISFAARYVSTVTELECQAALQMWKEMEHIAGVKGNSATFNVLFDVACKAGKFTLAEMIYKEMENRHLQTDRFHHVSMIFYYGLQKSGDGARSAYKTLVEAGEIVDTVVLNAMISALIRSHETSAAENIYERMKRSHLENPDSQLQPRDFKKRRSIRRILQKMAIMSKGNEESRKAFQAKSIIAPDLHTFRILINHFAVDVGELDKTKRLLDEMSLFELPLHGSLFLALFKGFSKHGGVRYTQWTAPRLERVWQSLLYALENGSGVSLSQWMVLWILRAFAKCSGKARTLAAWEEIKGKWDPDPSELDFVMSSLRTILEAPDQAMLRYDWVQGSL